MTVDQPISIPPNTTTGKARIRVIYQNAWRHLSDPNAKNILDGVAYDINLNVLDHDPSIPDLPTASYAIPSGTMHPQGNAYLTRVYTPQMPLQTSTIHGTILLHPSTHFLRTALLYIQAVTSLCICGQQPRQHQPRTPGPTL